MSVIQRQDLITDQAFNWPKEYAQQLSEIAAKSKQLGQGSAKQGATELEKVQKNLAIATERSTKEYIEQKAALDKLNKTNREAVKDVNALDSAYDSLSRELNQSRKAYKDLAAAGQANTAEAKKLQKQVTTLDARLKKIDASVGQNQRSVGKYTDALKNLGGRFLGVVGAITAFIGILRNGLQIIRNYTKANSTLNAVLGVTSKETKALRIQQKQLGESTAFAASEVAKAQTELARLGKTQEQIINLTPAILDGAVALGVDLAQAAELVAGQLNAFNLEAEEGQRVTDVLVKSTQISAFNFERLKTSLAVVSPAANAVNASIEDTVAVLSSAVDANIDASTAATGLRNIYIDLADKGITWDEAMNQINSSTDKLSTANELFGKRGAVVATVIADNTEKINANREALEKAEGTAKRFAEETLNNLDGSITLLNSAWEGFVLSLEDGEGVITRLTTGFVDLGTSILGVFTEINKFTASDMVPWYEKLGTVLGFITGNATTAASSLAKMSAINAASEVVEMAQALEGVAESDASEELKKVANETQRIAELHDLVKTSSPWEDLRSDFLKYAETQKEVIETRKSLEQKLTEDLKAINKKYRDDQKASDKEQLKIDKEFQKKKEEIITEGIAFTSELFTNFTDLRIQQIGQEIEALEFARNRDLEAAGDSEAAKFEINKQYDKERRDLERKQANTQKANSLFQIAINTAVAITKALPNVVLAGIAGALGAAQAAFVLSQPIPQFDKGSESTPSDYIAGEKRPEFRKSKGKWSLVERPTLFKNSPGDKIVSGKETDSILGTIQDITGKNILNDNTSILGILNNDIRNEKKKDELAYVMKKGFDELNYTMKRKRNNVSVGIYGKSREEIDRINKMYRR